MFGGGGSNEAQNGAGEQFDLARLSAVIEAALAARTPLDEVTNAVFAEVEAFAGRRDDDWTLLLARRC